MADDLRGGKQQPKLRCNPLNPGRARSHRRCKTYEPQCLLTKTDVDEFKAAAKRIRKEYLSSPEKARQFLIDSGYLDRNGEIAEPYKSAKGNRND